MRQVSEGIVLTSTRYGDNRLVVNIYTREEGRRGFLVRMPETARGKVKSSYFFPLSQLEIAFNSPKEKQELVYIGDVKVVYAYREMYSDIRKSSVACFLAEVMGRCISESETDTRFYDVLSSALRRFDMQREGVAEFHLFFLLAMAEYLGFYPHAAEHATDVYFDLREGCFVSVPPMHEDYLSKDVAEDLAILMQARRQSVDGFPESLLFASDHRQALLQALAAYCRIQSGIGGTFKSLEVLRDVFQ